MRSRLTARQMYERFLGGEGVRGLAIAAYCPAAERVGQWFNGLDGWRAYLRTEDSLRRSIRKAMKVTR
jgi:hypothetical protein